MHKLCRYITGSLSLLLVLAGCLKEDRSDCPPEGLYQLIFTYYGNGTTDIFSSRIENVYAYFFNSSGEYVQHYLLPEDSLNRFQGVVPGLEAGQYEVVCWGNVTPLSQFRENTDLLSRHFLYNRAWLAGEAVMAFDSLYYGRQSIVIPEFGTATDTVRFHSEHIRMNIFIRGLESTIGGSARAVGDPQGWMIVRNAFTGYDFYGEVTGETTDFSPGLTADEEGILTAMFDLWRFRNNNSLVIDIYNGAGEPVHSLNLADYLYSNNIDVEAKEEVVIPIYIRFGKADLVYVSVEKWDSEDVDPVT